MLVIIDVKPKDLGLPTEAYISVEEVHDVSIESGGSACLLAVQGPPALCPGAALPLPSSCSPSGC